MFARESKEKKITPLEYWNIERDSEARHELIDGELYELSEITGMAGASTPHNRITGNAFASLHNQLRGKRCEPLTTDQRIRVSVTSMCAYPDILVVCSPLEYDDELPDTILNPRVIIEVLSPSTERKDHTRKWFNYQQLESLTDYLMIAQDERLVEHYVRHEGGGWNYSFVENEGDVVLASIDCQLNLADIYERVEL